MDAPRPYLTAWGLFMSMICSLRRVSDADLRHLRADPAQVSALLEEDDSSALPLEEVKPRGLLGLLWRFVPITITQVRADAPLPEPHDSQAGLEPNPNVL